MLRNFHFNQLWRFRQWLLYKDWNHDVDDNVVFVDDDDTYLLIGISTDFGSGWDRVTGPKALKPQGLLVRGLTCISSGTHHQSTRLRCNKECTRTWCRRRRSAGAVHHSLVHYYISCTSTVVHHRRSGGGTGERGKENTFVSPTIRQPVIIASEAGSQPCAARHRNQCNTTIKGHWPSAEFHCIAPHQILQFQPLSK